MPFGDDVAAQMSALYVRGMAELKADFLSRNHTEDEWNEMVASVREQISTAPLQWLVKEAPSKDTDD